MKSTDNLFLILKAKWYWMIHDQIKKEEYRQITEYWDGRLNKEYKAVTFQLGYSKRHRMQFEIKDIIKGIGKHAEWGADPHPVYIIKLGNKLN